MGSHLKKAGEGKAFGIASIEPDRRSNEHGYRLDYFERLVYFIEDYIPKLIYKEDLEKYRADREKKLLKLEEAYQAKHAGKVADADKDTSSGAPQAAQTKKKKWGLFG